VYIYGVCIRCMYKAGCIYMCKGTSIHIYMYIHTKTQTCMHTYMHTRTNTTHMHIYINMIYPSICPCAYASMVSEMMVGTGGVDQSLT